MKMNEVNDATYRVGGFNTALLIDQFRVLGSGLELACNGGSCGGIPLKRD